MKKLLSLLLTICLIIGIVPLGTFTFTASAEMSGYYTYTVTNNKATIIDVDTSISGDITIPSKLGGYSVTSIDGGAFSGCTSLESITIPDSVTSIGYAAFDNCTRLESVTIGDSVTSIGGYAFRGCSSLESVTIGDSVTSIGYSTFSGCTSLESITIPDSVTSIGSDVFENCTSLESITISDSVTSIGSDMFKNCTSLESITIPDSVTSIGSDVFENCTSLESITIPDSVTSIAGGAFYGCTSLENVQITDIAAWCNINFSDDYSNPLCYANNLYLNGELVKDIIISEGVTTIRQYAFSCTSLENITISDSVTSIGDYAFDDCTSLKSITIPDSVTSIGCGAFYGCTSLNSVTIGNSITYIEYGTFYNCSSLTNITLPDSISTIYDHAFAGCTSLQTINIPNSVIRIYRGAFSGCWNLKKIYTNDIAAWCNIYFENPYSNPLYYANNLYLNDELVVNLIIPDGITNIRSNTFYNCKSITNVIIPNGVSSISEDAFYGCSNLTSITIPDSVTSIGEEAFRGTNNLWHILYTGTIDEWSSIDIDVWDEPDLSYATIHYNANGNEVTCEYEPATCAKKGYKKAECSICKMDLYEEYGSPKHTYDNICDITCNVCGGVTYEFNHDYDYCFKNYSESLGEYGNWKLTPSQSGVYKINPDSNSKKGFSPHYITVVGPDNNVIAFNDDNKGWPLIKGFEYTIKLRYDYTDGNYSDIDWTLENTGATLFPDAANSQWYSDAIAYAYGTGIMKGYANGLFGTADGIQRQDFLVMLARYDGVNLDEYSYASNIFSDVAQGSYYQAAVNWGYRHGIVTGYNDGRFGVGDMITREQIVTFLYRYAKYKNIDVENVTDTKAKAFPDYNKVTDFAEEPIIWAIDKGVINGKSGYIAPQGNAQRCEIAQIMYNIFQKDIF